MVIAQYILPISIMLGLFLSSIWLVFFLLEDRNKPEPKLAITKTFFFGMISAMAAAALEKGFSVFCAGAAIHDYSILSLTGNSLIEELIKFIVVFVFISASRDFDEPVDRMIYMIVAALGFATTENFFFLSNATTISELAGLSIMRFIGATLMHSLSSGMLGYAWAKGKLLLGLVIATIVHTIFNFLILEKGPETWPTAFLLFVAFILFYEFDRIKQYYYERKKR
ncbi:MAG: PrsW family glutamic-type intramembrane protease [Candidatus Colwellbacteria bacterium]|nr:PrsW family glutamic-type intramembrane protease [Candidatus Colwellbacteria bacterium]